MLHMDEERPSPPRRGRKPRLEGAAARERFGFRISASERHDLLAVANELGQDASEFVREAVNEAVADFRERKLFKYTRRRRDRRRH
jgi:uncharacterized protein (DUF1778 family)